MQCNNHILIFYNYGIAMQKTPFKWNYLMILSLSITLRCKFCYIITFYLCESKPQKYNLENLKEVVSLSLYSLWF